MALADAFFVDSGITVTNSPASATIAGLGHLVGETVTVLGDGVVYTPTGVVSAGGTVTISTAVSTAQVGLASTYKLRTMKMGEVAGVVAAGSIKKIYEIAVNFYNTLGATYGKDATTLYPFHWTSAATLNTGIFEETLDGGFSTEDSIYIVGSDPLPCIIRAIIPRVDRTGR